MLDREATPKPSASLTNLRPLAIVLGAVVIMYFARGILVPLAFAIVLSLIWAPPIAWLQRLHIKRSVAVLVVLSFTLAVAGGIGWTFFDQLISVANDLPRYQANVHAKLQSLSASNKGSLGKAAQNVQRLGDELKESQAPEATTGQEITPGKHMSREPVAVEILNKPANNLDYLRDLVARFAKPVGLAGVVLIFSVFLLIEQSDVRNRLFRLVGLSRMHLMTKALEDTTQRISRYLLLLFAVNAGFGVVVGAVLHMIGLPYAALWGTAAAFLRFVPYVGTLVAGALPVLVSFAVFNEWWMTGVIIVLFGVLELIVANWVEPRLYGAYTGISSLAILVAAVFWTILWGPAGLILSTPLTVCVAVLGRYVPQLSFLNVLLGDEPAIDPDSQLYQRLLAMDQAEAKEVVDTYLKDHTLLELYDFVLVPALRLAEQDRHKGSLESHREKFLFACLREMVAEFSDFGPEEAVASEGNEDGVEPDAREEQRIVRVFNGRVLCISVSDEADELVADMLAQLLVMKPINAFSFSFDSTKRDALTMLQPNAEDIAILSALPPFAFGPARTEVRDLRLKFPQTPLALGVWGYQGDIAKALSHFEPPRPNHFVTTLAEAISYVESRIIPNQKAA